MASQGLKDVSSLISSSVDSHYELIKSINYKIHAEPELAYEEHKAHANFVELLTSSPFTDLGVVVTPHAYGVDTAFSADFGAGGRLVIFNAEYDALPGIGHACGHNLIASSALAGFLGAVHALKSLELPGRVRLLGCPAEEGGAGKLKIIDAGGYVGASACLMTHPGSQYLLKDHVSGVAAVKMLANVKKRISFAGQTAHAAMEPWNGVNALDAVCLSYNAVSMLRQQIRPHERIHGVFDQAGDRPNVVPGHTKVTYYVRSDTLAAAERLWERVKKCFEGAALATGCQVSYEDLNSYADLRSSLPLCEAFVSTMSHLSSTPATTESHDNSTEKGKTVSLDNPSDFLAGSTDMGNVCYECPGFHGAFGIDTAIGQGNHTVGFADAAGLEKSLVRAVDWGKGIAIVGWGMLSDDAFAQDVQDAWEKDMKLAAL